MFVTREILDFSMTNSNLPPFVAVGGFRTFGARIFQILGNNKRESLGQRFESVLIKLDKADSCMKVCRFKYEIFMNTVGTRLF